MVDEVEYSQFLAVHRGQLIMADIPEQYWTTLHKKLKNEASFMPVSEYIADFQVFRVVCARGICMYQKREKDGLTAEYPATLKQPLKIGGYTDTTRTRGYAVTTYPRST